MKITPILSFTKSFLSPTQFIAPDLRFQESEFNTSAKEIQNKSTFAITPNPLADRFIYFSSKIERASYMDINGNSIINRQKVNGMISIPENLPNGIYLLKLEAKGHNAIHRVVLSRF